MPHQLTLCLTLWYFLFHTWNPLFDNVLLWKLLRFILSLYQNFSFFLNLELFCLRQYWFKLKNKRPKRYSSNQQRDLTLYEKHLKHKDYSSLASGFAVTLPDQKKILTLLLLLLLFWFVFHGM